jgi:hypothetical protein
MKAILSTTYDDQYLFYLPITTWAWNKLGIGVVCFVPALDGTNKHPAMDLIFDMKWWAPGLKIQFVRFSAPIEKQATYAQCSRLFGAATPLFEDDDVLITSDVDMAVFNKDFFDQFNDGRIHVIGADLVPDGQYPMCYITMSAEKWREVMWIPLGVSHQEKLDDLLGGIECENFRGNYWAKDQETIYSHLWEAGIKFIPHYRASPGTQFATRRADRDGWPEVIPPDIIDAHMPRPGYTPENFAKILNLFQAMYPEENFEWMIEYRNEYVKLLNQ